MPRTAPSPSTADALSQGILARAYRKVMDKKELSHAEAAALKRHEKEKEERLRWQYYKSIPQKHWRSMSGRQTKVLNEQAARYGIPFGGATINLPDVVHALHDFLAANAHRLNEDDAMMAGPGSPALERYREERAALARLDRLQREAALIPCDEVRTSFSRIAGVLRTAGEALEREFGPGAAEVLHEALEDAAGEVDRVFGKEAEAVDASDRG